MKNSIDRAKAVPKRVPIRQSDWDRFRHGKYWFAVIVEQEGLRSPLSLDIGSGGRPFPYANVLCDLNLKPTPQRDMRELEMKGKPFVVCDAQFLPFKTQAFDFATCLYLFEHVDDPGKIYSEMRRVSRHGYVQNPSWFNEEIMYGEPVHKWVITVRDGRLCFRPVWKSLRPMLPIDYVFQRLYRRFFLWRLIHTILDESLNLFTTRHYY
jgi:SAM-dependent methyltransferase